MNLHSMDTTKTIGVEKSISKLVLLLGVSAVFFAAGLWMATDEAVWARRPDAAFWGWVAVAFGGLCFSAILWRLVVSPKVVVTISATGIRDLRASQNEIPWSAIVGIVEISIHSQKLLGLNLVPGTALKLPPIAKVFSRFNKSYGADVFLATNDLKLSFEDLSALIHTYWSAHGPTKSNDGLSPAEKLGGA